MRNAKQRIAAAILLCAGFMLPVSVTAAQQTAVEKRSSAWDLLRKSRSKQTESAETPTKERVVNFPKDRSLGQLYIKDAGSVRQLNGWFHWTDTGEAAMKMLNTLTITKTRINGEGLAALKEFPDLAELNLLFMTLGDKRISHLANLPKLKKLWLGYPDFGLSDEDLAHLGTLSSLRTLHIRLNRDHPSTS